MPEDPIRMNRAIAVALSLLAISVALPISGAAQPAQPSSIPGPALLDEHNNALFKRMVALNSALRTYTATVHLDVALKSFPFISPSIDGNVYYKRPDKTAVIFDTVPALASQFKKVYPRVDPPGLWTTIYDVAVISDDGTVSLFRLRPKKNGRVDHLDVKVDDPTATILDWRQLSRRQAGRSRRLAGLQGRRHIGI
jgi:hypothetical protein